MIRFFLFKIVRFFCRLISKLVYFSIPVISRIFIAFRLHSRIINQLNKLKHESHKIDNFSNLVSQLLGNNKMIALDVGAQGGFNGNIFPKKYNIFF